MVVNQTKTNVSNLIDTFNQQNQQKVQDYNNNNKLTPPKLSIKSEDNDCRKSFFSEISEDGILLVFLISSSFFLIIIAVKISYSFIEKNMKNIKESYLVKRTFNVPGVPERIHSSSMRPANPVFNKPIMVKQESNPVQISSQNVPNSINITESAQQSQHKPIINIKVEEGQCTEFPKIRKKICRKMLSIFHEEFKLEKTDAKK